MTIDNKHIKALVVSVACTFATGVIMLVLQTISSNAVENSLADRLLSEIPKQLDIETAERKEQIREYDLAFLTDLVTIKYVMSTCGQNVFLTDSGKRTSTMHIIWLGRMVRYSTERMMKA